MFYTRQGGYLRFPIRVTVVGMFLLVTMLTAAVAIGLQYHFSSSLATQSALQRYRMAAVTTSDQLAMVENQAVNATQLLAIYPGLSETAQNLPLPADMLERFAQTLQRNPLFYAIYIGHANGDVHELVNLNTSSVVRGQLQALPEDRWVVIRVSGEGKERQRVFSYLDSNFHERARRAEQSDYRADTRPWFTEASAQRVSKTEPYLFQHLQAPGQTYSMRIPGSDAVLAVDIALSALSERLTAQLPNGDGSIYLYQQSGEIIASSEQGNAAVALPNVTPLELSAAERELVAGLPVLRVSNETDWPPFDFTVAGEPQGYAIDLLSLVSQMTGLRFRYNNGYSWPQLQAMYQRGEIDILHPVLATEENRRLGQLTAPLVEAPFGVLTRRGEPAFNKLEQLRGKKVAIPAGWSSIALLREAMPQLEIVEVDGVSGMFAAVREGRVAAGIDVAAFLRYTARQYFYDDVVIHAPLDFGELVMPEGLHYLVHPSQQEEVVALIDRALQAIETAQRDRLAQRWLLNGVQPQHSAVVPYAELLHLAADPGGFNRLQKVSLNGRPHFVYLKPIDQVGPVQGFFAVITPEDAVLGPPQREVRAALLITSVVLLLLLPLAYALGSFIVTQVGQLVQENRKIIERRYNEVRPVQSRIVELDELASSLMEMAQAIQKHAKEQEALMDSFIELIAQAIDDKSPYTAGHCARVPELALMLAQQAESSSDAPFDTFRFDGEQQWREFRIGAWLHDCGKITTPEHVVDKATKLETIHNRIHEIRTRFEVLWRDTEIDYWQQRFAAPDQEEALREKLTRRQTELKEEFAFIAACNLGGEFMAEEDIARLEKLAQTTWQRNFDDRLGLAPMELARFDDEPEALPATERLLGDKPWHIIEREHSTEYPPHLGIRMEVPEHLYNRGELHNLKIARGTLTAEDRFKINEHMISTIKMLDKLPLPKELERVPRYASTHHETLDGRGYPRKLSGEDLSIPERIMVLSDIFEALTAADRPYKPAKPVSVAIDILHKMVLDSHVDRDVFELFLRSGTYLEYARRYLPARQIDEVDISRYLAD